MGSDIANRLHRINAKLTSDVKAKIQKDWLMPCVEYFLNENPSIQDDLLYKSVLEQFTLANIADTSHRVIPETFSTTKNAWTLKESLLLQMNFIVEVSEPFYDQWRSLHNKVLDDVAEDKRESKSYQSKKKRMFKMELTDGYKTIHAMEMKQIACLNTKLMPGIKILFIAPMLVVNHIMQIKPENVRIIGGEVEELLITNAYENVLLRLLNRPITNKPILNYKELTVENETSSNANRPQNLVRMEEQQKQNQAPKVKQQTYTSSNAFIDDDDDLDLAMIEAIEQQEIEKSQEMLQPRSAATAIDDDIDDDLLAQIDMEENLAVNRRTNAANKRKSVDSPEEIVNIPKVIRLAPARVPTYTDPDYPYKIDERYNFVTIDQYSRMKLSDKMAREYALEAAIEKVSKIKACEDGWLLNVDIKDKYSVNTLFVRFDDEIVATLGRKTARELLLLRHQMMNGQPQLKMDIATTLELINQELQLGPFIMCVQMKARLPADYENVVTKLLEKTEKTRSMINLKIEKERISSV